MEQKFPNCMAMHLQKQNEGRIENKIGKGLLQASIHE